MHRAAEQLHHPLRTAIVALTVAVFVVLLGAAYSVLAMRADLERGRDRLEGLDVDALRAQGLAGVLDAAADDLDAADRHARSAFLDVLAPVPVVGDQVAAVRDLTGAAATLGGEARTTGRRISRALDRAGGRPAARLELLDTVLAELDRVESVTAGIELGAGDGLLPPLRAARADVRRSLDRIPERLEPLAEEVAALRQLLAGPTSYLVVVGNNAEMRAGAGMPLSAGLATFSGGDIDLGDFESTVSELYADGSTGFVPRVPDVLRETYPRWNLGRDFPETAVIPHFPVTAPLYAEIARDTQGWEVDGVLHIDAIALAELLDAVGPVEIDGTTFTRETAPQLVLNQPYLDFGDRTLREQRLEVQSQLANALFEAIQQRDVDLLDVVAALQRAAEGRHLMAWSRDPVLEDLFASFGADGALAPNDTLVSFQNTAANKLDWYIHPRVDAVVEPLASGGWRVTLRASLTNPAEVRTSPYIDGRMLADGTHRVLVTAQVPPTATGVTVLDREITELGHDGISQVVGARFTVPRGATRHVTFQYDLPASAAGIRVVPSARVEPVAWTLNGRPFHDDRTVAVGFPPRPEPMARAGVAAAWAGVLLAVAGVAFLASSARSTHARRDERMARVDAGLGAALFAAAFAAAAAALVLV